MPWTIDNRRRFTAGSFRCPIVVAFTCMIAISGCRFDGRSSRAQKLLSELAPQLLFGERLADARRAIPTLRVRHLGDPIDIEIPGAAERPMPVAVVVSPVPAPAQHASPDAGIDGVEFVMTPSVAQDLRRHITEVFHMAGTVVCAGRSISYTDSIVVWELGRRGGALLTFPERRADEAVPVSRLFVYTGAWKPERSLSGFGTAQCASAS